MRFMLCAVLASLFSTTQVHASSALRKVFSSPTRPTIQELKEILGTLSEEEKDLAELWLDPVRLSSGIDRRLEYVREEGPLIVAQMEAAFSDAIWVPLGRDAALVGDFLDAFYLAQGEKNRVRRLDFGAEVKSLDPELLQTMLENLGFDPQREVDRPYIIIDCTSYQKTSQSYLLLAAGYSAMAEAGVDNPVLRLNALNLNGSTFDIKSRQSALRFVQNMRPHPDSKSEPNTTIASVDAKTLTRSEAWHGPFEVERHGTRVEVVPGKVFSEHHPLIVAEMLGVIEIVSTPEFLERVQREARRLGSVYPPLPAGIPAAEAEQRTMRQFEMIVQDIEKMESSQEEALVRTLEWLDEEQKLGPSNKRALRLSLFELGFSLLSTDGEEDSHWLMALLWNHVMKQKRLSEGEVERFAEIIGKSPQAIDLVKEIQAGLILASLGRFRDVAFTPGRNFSTFHPQFVPDKPSKKEKNNFLRLRQRLIDGGCQDPFL